MGETIAAFLAYAARRLHPLGVRVSADVFGLSATTISASASTPARSARSSTRSIRWCTRRTTAAVSTTCRTRTRTPWKTVSFSLRDFRVEARRGRRRRSCRGSRTSRSGQPYRLPQTSQAQVEAARDWTRRRVHALERGRDLQRQGARSPAPKPQPAAALSRHASCSRLGYPEAMAATRAIELKTAIPGPRSQEILGAEGPRRSPSRCRSTCRSSRRRAAARRSPTSTATRSSTSPAASAASTSATRIRTSSKPCRSRRRGSCTPTSRSSRTRSTSTLAERLLALAPFRGDAKAAFFNAGTEAVENGVKFARAYTGRPAVIAFEGALPRPHAAVADAHVEDASVQGGARPVRARGLPRSVPERVPRHHDRRRARRARARAADAGRAGDGRGDRARAVQGEGGFIVAPQEFVAGRPRASATATAS